MTIRRRARSLLCLPLVVAGIVVPSVEARAAAVASGVALASDGSVYVVAGACSDSGMVTEYDVNATPVRSFGTCTGTDALQAPLSIAVGVGGDVYVSDSTPRIVHYSSTGTYLGAWAPTAAVTCLGFDPGRGEVLGITGAGLQRWSQDGSSDAALAGVQGTCATPDGSGGYVTNGTALRRYGSDGTQQWSTGLTGGQESGVAVDPFGNAVHAGLGYVYKYPLTLAGAFGNYENGGTFTQVGSTNPNELALDPTRGLLYVTGSATVAPTPGGTPPVQWVPGVVRADLHQVKAVLPSGDTVTAGQQTTIAAGAPGGPGLLAPATYSWDLDGNGTYETSTGEVGQVVGAFTKVGTVTVSMKVTPLYGGTAATATESLTVVTPDPPDNEVPGLSIDDGQQFTNTTHVTLTLIPPAGATGVVVSNDGGFHPSKAFGIVDVPWTLGSSGPERLPKTVYLHYTSSGRVLKETYTDDIILDETPPVISSATATSASGASAKVLQARLKKAPLVKLHIKASDKTSGVSKVQVTTSKKKPGTAIRYGSSVSVRIKGRTLYVRVIDRAGNPSTWRTVHVT